MSARDRALSALAGNPKVVGFVLSGDVVRLTLSFHGCDDDLFRIDADLTTVVFEFPSYEESA